MKKLVIGLSILGLLWIAKLTYDLQHISQQVENLQSQIVKTEQAKDNLNDQLIALQRQVQQHLTANKDHQKTVAQIAPNDVGHQLSPLVLIRQELDLIEFATKQNQNVYAISQIQKLTQQIGQYEVAETLKQSLYDALDKDQRSIEQYSNQQQQQLLQFIAISHDINDQMNILLDKQNQQYQPQQKTTYIWQKWFDFQPTQQPKTNLIYQSLTLKEAQLRFTLAQQFLVKDDYDHYQQSIDDIVNLLQQTPGFEKTKLMALLATAKQLPTLTVPKLTSLDLVNG